MYEEIIKALRNCDFPYDVHYCRKCVCQLEHGGSCDCRRLFPRAADAIEELDAICKRQMIEIAVLGKERKDGVWIGEGDGYADGNMVYDMWSCGCCGTRFDEWEEKPTWKYCPVCGSHNGGDEDV